MGVSLNSSRRADRRHTCAAHARTCAHSPAVLSAAEANGSRRSAAAEAAAAGEETDPAVGWGLSAGDIEEAVGFHTLSSSSSSPTSGSGRVHAVEEVKCQFNPWLLILNDSTEIRFFSLGARGASARAGSATAHAGRGARSLLPSSGPSRSTENGGMMVPD